MSVSLVKPPRVEVATSAFDLMSGDIIAYCEGPTRVTDVRHHAGYVTYRLCGEAPTRRFEHDDTLPLLRPGLSARDALRESMFAMR